MSRSNRLQKKIDQIMEITDGGRDVYENELGKLSMVRNLRAPWRTDAKPSLKLNVGDNDIVWFQDFGGNQASGHVVHFIAELYGIGFKEAVEKIIEEYEPGEGEKKEMVRIVRDSAPKIIQSGVEIDFEDCPFEDKHRKYWTPYLLGEQFLRDNHVFAVGTWAKNKRVQKIPPGVAVFAYEHIESGKVKILQIGEGVEQKWLNTVDNRALWYYNDYLEGVEDLFVCKSVKDALVFRKMGYAAIAVQNESAKILLKNNVERIEAISSNPILVFGTDIQGKTASQEVSAATGWQWFNTKNYLLEYGINDPAELVKEFSYNSLEKELTKKGFKPIRQAA